MSATNHNLQAGAAGHAGAASRHADVTVVIPCFNHGRYVAEAVESALSQEGGEPHVIVVDDGSTEPDVGPALDALPGAVEIVHREHEGPGAARNAGAALTETPLLLMLDADDRLVPDALDALKKGLDENPGCGYAYGVMRLFGAWSAELHFPDFDAFRLLYRPIVGGPGTMLVRRTVFEEIGGYDPDIPGYEDWDFQLSALEHGYPGHRIPRVTVEYRKHEVSNLSRDRARFRPNVRALRAKHRQLFARRRELAADSDLGPLGKLFYRTWWAYRPLPARIEQALYRVVLR